MIDKLLLNNQIISNKKKIQKARVQTINKLVQKIRKLKELSKKYPDKANIDTNLKRTPIILSCVKKLKVGEIIRKILTLPKKPAAILTNGQAKPEDVALAFLATNKIIDDITTALRVTLHLNDNNPGWQNEILELSKKKKFLLKNAERKMQKKTGNKSKMPSSMVKPSWREENVDIIPKENPKSAEDVAQTSGWKVEPLEKVLKNAAQTDTKSPKPISKPRREPQEREITPEPIEDDNPTEMLSPTSHRNVTTIDSFFFTSTGDNYVSSVVLRDKQPDGPDDGLDRRERRQHNRRSHQSNDRQMRPPYNKRSRESDGLRMKPYDKHRNDKRHSESSFREKPRGMEQNLHPSWAAKQKMNPSGVEFKGRKIKFDDNSNELNEGKSSEKPSHKSRASAAAPNQNSENLHPSWAAKQKLKPTITEFKGTKITFDD